MPTYSVFIDDNFHYMDESERYKHGDFEDCRGAIEACKGIVDRFLARCDRTSTAEELYTQYTTFGEDPWIGTDDPDCKFSAWDYAKQRCHELSS